MNFTRRYALTMVAICGLIAATSSASIAHDAEKGPNGGQLITAKGHHVELVAKAGELTLYLSDEAHQTIPSKGASGRAVILEGAKQSTVALAVAEPNILTAKLAAPLVAGTRVVVSAKLADGHDILARFVVK